jgi:hypothetical protein
MRVWYAKARSVRDFGHKKFGKTVDRPRFIGRRVDLMGRGISATTRENPVVAVQRYLGKGDTPTARFLAEKAVVLMYRYEINARPDCMTGTPGCTSACV